jgi:acyl dehydratase
MTVPADRLHPEIRELCVPFAGLPSLVGRSFLGDWFVVDAGSLPLFDRASYTDRNPYPLDARGYPEDMVEGFHLLALLDHLVNPLLRVSDGPCVAWNYGLDRVRFVSPVCAGQKIRVKGTVGAVRRKGSGFLILSRCAIEVEGRERPGMVADWWTYWLAPAPLAAGPVPARACATAGHGTTAAGAGDE